MRLKKGKSIIYYYIILFLLYYYYYAHRKFRLLWGSTTITRTYSIIHYYTCNSSFSGCICLCRQSPYIVNSDIFVKYPPFCHAILDLKRILVVSIIVVLYIGILPTYPRTMLIVVNRIKSPKTVNIYHLYYYYRIKIHETRFKNKVSDLRIIDSYI